MKKVPLNKDAYSESSKRSEGFWFLGDTYEDIRYQCKKCTKSTIFSAEEQKETYEVKKRYMWQQRTLCNDCYKEMLQIKTELQDIEEYYCSNKQECLQNRDLLLKWLRLLNEYPTYWQKGNPSRVVFVKKVLGLA